MAKETRTPEDRFWSKVRKGGPDECWEWTASLNTSGYGQIGWGGRRGRSERAHRVSYMLAHGLIPDGLCVMHSCDNRKCVNPNHLSLGTKADNNWDKVRKGRQGNTGPKGEQAGNAVFTDELIVKVLLDDRPHHLIAADYGVDRTAIGHIKTGKNWSHVRPDIPRKLKYQKISPDQVSLVKEMRAAGYSYSKIARDCKISMSAAFNIIRLAA